MSEMEKEPANFTPREYQEELLKLSLDENIIVYLPTGSGKTFIAAMLIQEKRHEVSMSLEHGGKRTVFLAPTVVLVTQQAAYLQRHTHLTVKEYYGSMGVDLWTGNRWAEEFDKAHVLVMTPQIFLDILNHAFFSMEQVNVLVVDECHSAVKDAPVKLVFNKLDSCRNSRPRILGLTAALFRKRLKPEKVPQMIKQLADTMNCTVCMPTNMRCVLNYSTNPRVVICGYRDWSPENCFYPSALQSIENETCKALREMNRAFGKKYQKQSSKLKEIIEELLFLIGTFGVFGLDHAAKIYQMYLEKLKLRRESETFLEDAKQLSSFLATARDNVREVLGSYSDRKRLQLNITRVSRVARLLKILARYKPLPEQSTKFAAIVFVERRSTANVLYHMLKEATKTDEHLSFIRPSFTIGQAAKPGQLKDVTILGMKQREVMKQFRNGDLNVLIATSVLEEGIDVPSCNLIVRFDLVKTFCDYVQCKGRARCPDAEYFLMVSESETSKYLDMLAEFHAIEQQLLDGQFGDDEHFFDIYCQNLVDPYAPFGLNGPMITFQASIALVNRYSASLSTDATPLVPEWILEEVSFADVDPEWLSKIRRALPSSCVVEKLYQCRLQLPLNSPLRDEIVGKVMPAKRAAKRAVSLETCKRLHELGELDDAHLLPICRSLSLSDLFPEEKDSSGPRPGTRKRIQSYPRQIASVFQHVPRANQTCFVYALNLKLLVPCNDDKKSYVPSHLEHQIGLLTSDCVPRVCPFPLLTRAGEVEADLLGVGPVELDEQEMQTLRCFHRHLVENVMLLFKQQPEFDFQDPILGLLFVPLVKPELSIDLDFAKSIIRVPQPDWTLKQNPSSLFRFDSARYADAVVTSRHEERLTTYYVDAVSETTLADPFPNPQYNDFADYYLRKYNLIATDPRQRLLEVSREIPGRNYLVRRQWTGKDRDGVYLLVPEFCHVHTLPASLWKQVVWLPSIVWRLNSLILAEEFRCRIVQATGVGQEFLPYTDDSSWPSLATLMKKNDPSRETSDTNAHGGTRRKIDADSPNALKKRKEQTTSPVHSFDNIWNLDLTRGDQFDLDCLNGSDQSPCDSPINSTNVSPPTAAEANNLSCLAKGLSFTFDHLGQVDQNHGPSLGMILQALTTTKANEGFDMERLETVGDSILKLATSIAIYGQTAGNRQMNEGYLTFLRIRQISNRNLYTLGQKLGLGSLIVVDRFDLTRTFLPPCVRVPEADDPRIRHNVPDKTIADCVEALIGAYLVTSGIKGALSFLRWVGLDATAGEVTTVNPDNHFPLLNLLPSVGRDASQQDAIMHLYDGMESFEKLLGYTFRDKTLLIEALSHPSYYPNRLTCSYQRLEFLGDAVLDFLVTYFYYADDNEHDPAALTDLRSATVNNSTFAVLAIRHDFHLYLKNMSFSLSKAVDTFVRIQQENQHRILDDYIQWDPENPDASLGVEVPKVLGDIFESVAGAIFIDSGMSLDTVWNAYYQFLCFDMSNFSQNIPKSPRRALYEKCPGISRAFKKEILPNGRICVSLDIDGKTVRGIACSAADAKIAAAKLALRMMM